MRYNTLHAHNMPLPTQLKDLEDFGMDKVIEMALEAAWDGCDAVYMSCESISSKPSRPCIIVQFERRRSRHVHCTLVSTMYVYPLDGTQL